MTFVRVRLMLDRIPSGACLEVLFLGEEPARNLPRAVAELGHIVLNKKGNCLLIRKA